jgi:uncharacterized protein GlcG (DUF336 family)
MTLRQTLTLGADDAARITSACLDHARSLGVSVCIAVADNGGHLVHFVRMDDAPLLSMSIAQDKAYSVVAFKGLPTDAWWKLLAQDDAVRHGIIKTDRLIVFGGGSPCLVDGQVVGAVGVSGGSAAQDSAIAKAGATAL